MGFPTDYATNQPQPLLDPLNYFYTRNISKTARLSLDGVGAAFTITTVIVELLFIYAIYRCRRMHGPLKVSNLCLLQKSIGDIIFVVSWNMTLFFQDTSVLPATTQLAAINATTDQKIGTYSLYVMNDVSFSHSILMLAMLSILRVRAVTNPALALSIQARPIMTAALIFSFLYCAVDMFYLVLLVPQYSNDDTYVRFSYYLINFSMFCLVPAIITTVAYRTMYSVLAASVKRMHQSTPLGSTHRWQNTVIEQRMLAAKRLVPLVGLFLVGWLPYWIVHLSSPFMTSPKSKSSITYARVVGDLIVTVSYTVKAVYQCFVSVHLRSHLTNTAVSMRRISTTSSIHFVATTSLY